jgi:hypothetical protein
MEELLVNLHMHTFYSDGHATHAEIAQAALRAGIDVAIVTDHNVWVQGPEDYYQADGRRMLLLVGEEIHDQVANPQKNHMLVFGVGRELATLAPERQRLLDNINEAGGTAFLAHIIDPDAPLFGEPDISWEDWSVSGYTGIELWNHMSEFKGLLKNKLAAVWYALNPRRVVHGPYPQAVRKWDELLAAGKRVVAVGGSDAHALTGQLGPLRRVLYPYDFHFQVINTHLLTPRPLGEDVVEDRRMIMDAFRQGHAFVGYDLPAPTRGFRFIAQGMECTAQMGDEISAKNGVTFQIRLPLIAECRLLKDGQAMKTWTKRETCTHITTEPGVYRVEVYLPYQGRRRAWIYSNPIYVRN